MKRPTYLIYEWLSRNAAIVVAICSMFIAALSLIYTMTYQRNEQIYRELSIAPVIKAGINPLDYQIVVVNIGLGPARITKVVAKMGDTCVISSGINDEQGGNTYAPGNKFGDKYKRLVIQLLDNLTSIVPKPRDGTSRELHATFDGLSVGTIIPAGKEKSIFGISDKSRNLLDSVLKKENLYDEFQPRFVTLASEFPFAFEACSLTGLSCSQINLHNVGRCWNR